MATLAAPVLRASGKPVETVDSGPRKRTERFGCNSHIGQLNATTSALSLPFAYGIHMLMMSLVFVFFTVCLCMCVCVCARALFVSSLVFLFLFFCLHFLPSSHSLCIAKQKEMQKIWIHTSSLWKKERRYTRPIFTSPRLTIKGEVRRVPQLFRSRAPDFGGEAPLKGREKASPSLFPEQLNAL